MARGSRKISAYGYYHVMIRGVNRQDVFLDDIDRKRFIDTMKRFHKETGVDIIVYCLMSNHVHILALAHDNLDVFMKKLSSSYVYYFNHKYGRIGHLFQDRYKSEAIESDSYLLTAARYILQNPRKAQICQAMDYEWSSWNDVISLSGFTKPRILYDLAEGDFALQDYLSTDSTDRCLDIEVRAPLSDSDALKEIRRILGEIEPKSLSRLSLEKRNFFLSKMKDANISAKQIEDLTGISRNVYYKI